MATHPRRVATRNRWCHRGPATSQGRASADRSQLRRRQHRSRAPAWTAGGDCGAL